MVQVWLPAVLLMAINTFHAIKGLVVLIRKKLFAFVYVAGLVLVALAVTVSHFIVDYQLEVGRKADQVVRLGYQQAVLAERVNQLSFRYVLSAGGRASASSQQELTDAVAQMYDNHLILITSADTAEFARAADEIYFGAAYELDLKLRTFLGAARELLQRDAGQIGPQHPLARFLGTEQTGELQSLLQQALQRYKATADSALRSTRITLWGLYAFIMIVLVLESLLVFRLVFKALMNKAEAFRELAQTDPLTGCFNRRSFMLAAEQAQGQVNRRQESHALLMLDIDHFKQVNDTYGHPVGDEVIRMLAKTCIDHLRSTDMLGRLGGEEFAVLLRGTTVDNAEKVAENLRQRLEACAVSCEGRDEPLHFTVSIGISRLEAGDDSAMDAIERADVALYRAKTSGRNRVVCHGRT